MGTEAFIEKKAEAYAFNLSLRTESEADTEYQINELTIFKFQTKLNKKKKVIWCLFQLWFLYGESRTWFIYGGQRTTN